MWSRVSRKSGGFHQRADPRPRQRLSAAVVQVCVPSPPGNNNSWELHIAGPLCWFFFFFLPPGWPVNYAAGDTQPSRAQQQVCKCFFVWGKRRRGGV